MPTWTRICGGYGGHGRYGDVVNKTRELSFAQKRTLFTRNKFHITPTETKEKKQLKTLRSSAEKRCFKELLNETYLNKENKNCFSADCLSSLLKKEHFRKRNKMQNWIPQPKMALAKSNKLCSIKCAKCASSVLHPGARRLSQDNLQIY